MFDRQVPGVLNMSVLNDSTIFDVASSLPHLLSSIQIDESSVSVLAMLAGVIGGWVLTGLHQQMKAKRVKLASRRRQEEMRK